MINSIQSFVVLIALLMVSACSHMPVLRDDGNTPNILFIYTDDQAPWALGASGNKQAFTPNLDQLVAEGMYFPNAYTATPVCSPSRAALLTSRYGYELGIDDWINTKGKSLTGLQHNLGLDSKFPTWVELLRDSGYRTGLVGKWHLGETDKHHPIEHGYQYFVGFRSGGTKTINPVIEKDGLPQKLEGLTVDILAEEAIDFIKTNRNNKFALSLHFRAPHTRWLPVSAEDAAPYKDFDISIPNPDYPDLNVKSVKKKMIEYLSSVRSIDRNVGLILKKLEQFNLKENTIVIFTSDHGYNMGHNGIWHKGNGHWILKRKTESRDNIPSGQRPNMYDTSIKVPTIVRWPKVLKPHSMSNASISNLDWFPTLVEIGHAKIPRGTVIRGRSFKHLLMGQGGYQPNDYYGAYSTLHQTRTHMRMYSDGQYKLIKDYLNKGRDEFYALLDDPNELNNLIATSNPKLQIIINRFDNIIFERMIETQDPIIDEIFGPKKR